MAADTHHVFRLIQPFVRIGLRCMPSSFPGTQAELLFLRAELHPQVDRWRPSQPTQVTSFLTDLLAVSDACRVDMRNCH